VTVLKKQNEWFEGWFDSPYYHQLYFDRDHAEAAAFIHRLLDYLKPESGAKALDLACGKGRHALQLSQLGLDVLGVDLSPQSIAHANKKKSATLHFEEHDMRLPVRTNHFDFVFNLFTSFGYFEAPEDDLKVIESIGQALVPNGILVLDFLNLEYVRRNLVAHEVKKVGDTTFQIDRSIEDGFIKKSIRFEAEGKNYWFQEKVRALGLSDFQSMLNATHLQIIDTFGNYALQPFGAPDSDRLLLIVQKVN